jgi:taurine dioxygenase
LGKDMPDVGGDTQFVNLYMAYEALSPAFQRMLESLSGVHEWARGPKVDPGKQLYPPVVHPMVRVHPESGRKSLYVADRIRHFVGMTEEESRPIVDFLMHHATRYEFMYRHRWGANDLVIWDNRCTLHYAVQDFDQEQLRRNWRSSLVGPRAGEVYIEPDSRSAVTPASDVDLKPVR